MKKQFRVEGVDCGNCAAKIERGVAAIGGVTGATFNFMSGKLTIEGDDARMTEIVAEAEKVMKKVEPDATMRKA